MALTTGVFAQLGYVYAVRDDRIFLLAGVSWDLNAAAVFSALAATAALAVPPLQDAFSTPAPSMGELGVAFALATAPLIATESLKVSPRHRSPGPGQW